MKNPTPIEILRIESWEIQNVQIFFKFQEEHAVNAVFLMTNLRLYLNTNPYTSDGQLVTSQPTHDGNRTVHKFDWTLPHCFDLVAVLH